MQRFGQKNRGSLGLNHEPGSLRSSEAAVLWLWAAWRACITIGNYSKCYSLKLRKPSMSKNLGYQNEGI